MRGPVKVLTIKKTTRTHTHTRTWPMRVRRGRSTFAFLNGKLKRKKLSKRLQTSGTHFASSFYCTALSHSIPLTLPVLLAKRLPERMGD